MDRRERDEGPRTGVADGAPPRRSDEGQVHFRRLRTPGFAILLVAPFFGEGLSGSTPPLDLLLPWNLAFMAALYGCGALICREVARRCGLGLPGLCLLGAAYGVYEEGLIDQYWYFPGYWDDTGVGSYSVVWQTNLLVALMLTAFHAAVSIVASVLVVEWIFPDHRERAWAGRRGLTLSALSLGLVVPLLYSQIDSVYGDPSPGPLVLVAAAGLCALLIGAAFLSRRLPRRPTRESANPRRGLGFIAFACTVAFFGAVFGLPSTGIPWPIGIGIAVLPIALGALAVRFMATGGPAGLDAMRVVTGIFAFFVLSDIFVGLLGRYDLIAGAIALVFGLRWLCGRERRRLGISA